MENAHLVVDCDFPGGNILVNRIDADLIEVQQDIRDTREGWFYWYFRVRNAAGRVLQVHFTGNDMIGYGRDVIGLLGPAASLDGAHSWRWLGRQCVEGQNFSFAVPHDCNEVRFSMGMPYLQANLDDFLHKHEDQRSLKKEILCTSRKGRPVEVLYFGQEAEKARHYVALSVRHHCCEMMASYELEGIIEFTLGDGESSRWLRDQVAFLAVPFVDKDGVEDGDQGKLRHPYDHGQDYLRESIYPETGTLRRLLPEWCRGHLDMALDLHCSMLRGVTDEYTYFVGEPEPGHKLWEGVEALGTILESNRRGIIPYYRKNNLPYGESWNIPIDRGVRLGFPGWANETFPSVKVSNIIEFPYALASGVEVNPESARAFGADLANAIALFFQTG